MSAAPNPLRISVEEYLASSYRPDCDYVDGEVQERNLGEFDHALTQALLVQLFMNNGREWGVLAVPEQRVQVSPFRVRVPDVCVLRRGERREQVVTRPPLALIEVLSPEDTLRSMRERVDDYFTMGTEHVLIIDPGPRRAYVCSKTSFQEPGDRELTIPGTPIRLDLAELFAQLDQV